MTDRQPTLKQRIGEDMKDAMRARDTQRLGIIRLILAAIQQREIDERVKLDDTQVLVVLDKMIKQRRDAIEQFQTAARQDLVDKERFEVQVIQEYLPAALSTAEIEALIDTAVAATHANSVKDMGAIMGFLRPKVQGRADMGEIGRKVKARLSP